MNFVLSNGFASCNWNQICQNYAVVLRRRASMGYLYFEAIYIYWYSTVLIQFSQVNHALFLLWSQIGSVINTIDLTLLWPLLLTWFNFNPSMDK